MLGFFFHFPLETHFVSIFHKFYINKGGWESLNLGTRRDLASFLCLFINYCKINKLWNGLAIHFQSIYNCVCLSLCICFYMYGCVYMWAVCLTVDEEGGGRRVRRWWETRHWPLGYPAGTWEGGHILGGGAKLGCGDVREEGIGRGCTKHGAPTHENQMKGRLDDSLGLWEEEREKKGAHKAVRVHQHLSIIGSVWARWLLLVLVFINVSIISQHVYCISIDVFNLELTQSLTSYVSPLLTAEVDGLRRKNKINQERKSHLLVSFVSL